MKHAGKKLKKIFTYAAAVSLAACTSASSDQVEEKPAATVQDVMEASGNRLTYAQAQFRVASSEVRRNAGLPDYLLSRDTNRNYYETCYQADYTPSQVPKESRTYYSYFVPVINDDTTTSTPLINFAKNADLFFCSAESTAKGTVAYWVNDHNGVVTFNDHLHYRSSMGETTLHEILHARQSDNRLASGYGFLSFEDMALSKYSREAAAAVPGRLYMFERHRRGDTTNWRKNSYKRPIDIAIEETYTAARIAGNNHKDALERAGEAGFHAAMQRPGWQRSYLNNVVRDIVGGYKRNVLRAENGTRFGLDRVRLTGEISPDFNFTRHMRTLPDVQSIIENFPEHQRMFDYLELMRIEQSLGADTYEYRKKWADLRRDNNPYLGVNLHEIDTNSSDHTAFEQMIAAASQRSGRPAPLRGPAA